ncbi:MAG TPA: serine hydrolase domain-containing protein [Euzebyales bacterium]
MCCCADWRLGGTCGTPRWVWPTHKAPGDGATPVGQATPDGTAMRASTPWFLASVTKLYIAAVVLRLHEQGMVELSEAVVGYLPERLARGLHVLDGVDYTSQLTLVHLLGHLSGLPDWLDERPPGAKSLVDELVEDGDRVWTCEDAVMRARDRLTPHSHRPILPRSSRGSGTATRTTSC